MSSIYICHLDEKKRERRRKRAHYVAVVVTVLGVNAAAGGLAGHRQPDEEILPLRAVASQERHAARVERRTHTGQHLVERLVEVIEMI